ncbi:MAG TPA: type II toxin-antitoxin system RelE/ParE family toxin [Candidatus Limnocylindrales bacterium]|nr:type II toxin-antitoxin system RelE/ParE family toxin [Candidatus Limnocylindrales bacterium]
MNYRVILSRSARKQLDRFSGETESRLLAKLTELEANPRPSGCKKLKNRDAWRIRVGDYRVIYEIHDKVLQVIIVTVGHRREVYR